MAEGGRDVLRASDSQNQEVVSFSVKSGSSLSAVSKNLEAAVLIHNHTVFKYKRLQVQLQMSMVGAAGQMPGEDMQRFQQLASLLYMNSDVQAYLMAEMQMQKTLADVFKILTEAAGIHFDIPEKQ